MNDLRPKRHRYEIPGQARFLTFSCCQHLPLLDADARSTLADELMRARAALGFLLYAWVIMPDHVHLLLLPRLPAVDVSRILRAVKRPVAVMVLRRLRVFAVREGLKPPKALWQAGGGYDRNLYSERGVLEKAEYMHANPVRRGLVALPGDWEWSSARAYLNQETRWPEIDRFAAGM